MIDDVITSHAQLIALLGQPLPRVAGKVRPRLHDLDRAWVQASPLVLVATSGVDGRCDVSPKGDPPGGFRAPDDATVVIPERPGNRRADGYHNIIENPHAGLIFLIPGRGDTLRVNGRARLVRDAPYAADFDLHGHRPRLFLEVAVEEVFHHCSKAFIRSHAWNPERWEPEAVARRAVIARTFERPGESLEQLDEYYGPAYESTVYVETAP